MKGYITKGIGGFYYVKTPEGIVECKPRGIFRKQKITPVAGDEVTLETENGAAVIAEIAPRKNVFVRPPMANLDVLFLVASTTQPTPSTLVLDKLAAIAVDKGVQPVIVCTKGDLAEAEFLRKAYEKSTLPFIRIDYETGGGLDEVKQWISGRLCAFCGNSGVGKSTLLNHLLPEAERETSAISQKLGRGRHTTRAQRLRYSQCFRVSLFINEAAYGITGVVRQLSNRLFRISDHRYSSLFSMNFCIGLS